MLLEYSRYIARTNIGKRRRAGHIYLYGPHQRPPFVVHRQGDLRTHANLYAMVSKARRTLLAQLWRGVPEINVIQHGLERLQGPDVRCQPSLGTDLVGF